MIPLKLFLLILFIPFLSFSDILDLTDEKNPLIEEKSSGVTSFFKKESFSKKETLSKKEKKKWSLSSSLSFSKGWKDSTDPFLFPSFALRASWKDFSFRLNQGFAYSFYVYENVSALKIANPSIGISYKLNKTLARDIKLPSVHFSFSLPFSEHSRINQIYSRLSLSSSLTKSFFKKKLNTSLSSSFIYYLNHYTTTVTEAGRGGGRNLSQMDFTLGSALSYKPLKWLSLNTSFAILLKKYEKNKWINKESNYGDPKYYYPLNHFISFNLGLALSYKKISFTLGHSHGQSVEQYGGVYWYLYDPEVSQFYLNLSYTY